MRLYLLYDKEGINECPIHGGYISEEQALIAKTKLAKEMTEECFVVDPKESGLDRDIHYEEILKECLNSIGIHILDIETNEDKAKEKPEEYCITSAALNKEILNKFNYNIDVREFLTFTNGICIYTNINNFYNMDKIKKSIFGMIDSVLLDIFENVDTVTILEEDNY